MDWWSEDIFGNECWSIGLKGIKQESSETILPIRAQGSNDWKEALQMGHGPIHALANDTGGYFGNLRSLQQGTSVTNISKLNDDHLSDVESDDGNSDNEDDDDDSDDGSDDVDDGNGSGGDDEDESGSVIVLDSDSSNQSSNVTFPTLKSELIDDINEVDSKFVDCKSNTDGNIYKLRNRVVTERSSQVDVIEDVNSNTKSFVLDESEEIREAWHSRNYIESGALQNNNVSEDNVDPASTDELQTRNSLQSETALTHPLKTFSCSLCKVTFSNRRTLKQHVITHRGKKLSVRSRNASDKLSHKSRLIINFQKRTRENFYQCSICFKNLSSKNYLTQHMNKHKGEKPFTCSFCMKQFAFKSNLIRHVHKHTEIPYSCSICFAKFVNKSTLLDHTCKRTGEKLFSCSVCTAKFTRKVNMIIHVRRHTCERSYLCSVCKKRFISKNDLTEHILTHTDERPFSCLTCSAKYRRKSSLINHNHIHTDEKLLTCPVCFKTLSRKQRLTEHMHIHTGERPFSCSTCKRNFTSKDAMIKHIRKFCS